MNIHIYDIAITHSMLYFIKSDLFAQAKKMNSLLDPRTEDFLFVKPLWVIGIIGIYLHFVYKSGSAFMKKKKPYKLNKILQLYNIMQIILNGYLLVRVNIIPN